MKKIIVMLLALAMIFSLTGCRNKVESPLEVSEKVLKAVGKLDVVTLSRYIEVEKSSDDFDFDFSDFNRKDLKKAKLLVRNFDYKILAVEEKAKTASVKVNVTTIDYKYVLSQYLRQAIGLSISEKDQEIRDEKLEAALIEILEDKNIGIVNTDIILRLNKIQDKWKVSLNETAKNTLLESILNIGEIFKLN